MTTGERTDQELLMDCQAGHLESFETLYTRYARGVLAYLLGALADRNHAEDLLQEIFIGFVRQIRALRPDTNVRAYLFSSARNRMLNAARDEGRKRQFTDRFEILTEIRGDYATGPGDALERKETLSRLNVALGSVNDEEREVILMHTQGDLTFEEIAEAAGAPLGSVTSRYRRGLEKLREAMEA